MELFHLHKIQTHTYFSMLIPSGSLEEKREWRQKHRGPQRDSSGKDVNVHFINIVRHISFHKKY